MAYIEIKNIKKQFDENVVIDNLSLNVEKGEFISLLGSSGCGKTTMLRMIAGFTEPTSGSIEIDNQIFYSLEENIMVPPGKRNLGMVFQSYAVWPHMNVFDNIAYPLKIKKYKKEEIQKRTMNIIKVVGLAGRENDYPHALSGGQQQRVALARALVMEPSVLLLDEPLSNLDAHLRDKMKSEIRSIQQELNITVIYVTHDQSEALQMSDRIVVMNKGNIEQIDKPIEIYKNPKTPFVASFIGKNNIFKYDNKEIAVRPENIFLTKEKRELENCIYGEIIQKSFQGTHYFYIIHTKYNDIMVQGSVNDDFSEKDKVYLSWEKEIIFDI